MVKVILDDSKLRKAADEGDMDEFVQSFVDAINMAIGGQLTAKNMSELTNDQITLLGWSCLHEEVMDGGYIQLIHNGFGAFIFRNPFGRMMRDWGLTDLYTHLKRCKKYYDKYHESIEQDMSDEDFMALYEQMPEFDEFDDDFVINEEKWVNMIAGYIDDHIQNIVG